MAVDPIYISEHKGVAYETHYRRNGKLPELFQDVEACICRELRLHRWVAMLKKAQYAVTLVLKKWVFVFRNYGFDGFLPVAVAVTALAAAYNVVDLSWLKGLVPPAQP